MTWRLIIVLCMFSITASAQQQVLTLQAAIDYALENNYGIKIARSNRAIAENNVTLGNAGFLPVVTASINNNNSLVNGEQIRGNDVSQIDNGENKSTSIGANLNWTVLDGGQMFVNYDILNQLNIQSEDALEFNLQTSIYNVSRAFYVAALESERLRLLNSNLGLSNERLSIAKDKYELGKGSKLEFLQAQVDYNADQSNILNQQQVYAAQKLSLLQLMNAPLDSDSLSLQYQLAIDSTLSLDNLLTSLSDRNQELKMMQRAEELARLQRVMAERDRLPRLNVFAGYSYNEAQRAVGFSFESNTTDLSYGFSANFTIFNGFNINRVIKNREIEAEIARYNYQQRILDLETSVRQLYLAYINNIALLELELQNVEVARENNVIAKERYDIGLSNALEYRESQNNLVAAEIRKQNAQFAAKLSEIELKYLAGIPIF